MKLVDVHAHLDFEQFDDSREEVIARSKEKGVGIINSGISPESTRVTLELAEKNETIFSSIGFMPYEKYFDNQMDLIKENADKIVCIGEVGLDYYWMKDEVGRGKERENFQRVIDLAKDLDKPLLIHSRNAEKDCIDILEKNSMEKVVMHCFSGSLEQARRAIDLDFVISIPTNITRSKQKQEFAEKLPLESLVLETDAPFLAPEPDSLNEPSNIWITAEKIAELKELKLEDVADATMKNTRRVFDI